MKDILLFLFISYNFVFQNCAIASIISNHIDINLTVSFPQVIAVQIQRNLDTCTNAV